LWSCGIPWCGGAEKAVVDRLAQAMVGNGGNRNARGSRCVNVMQKPEQVCRGFDEIARR
jgi:hypothetical protein